MVYVIAPTDVEKEHQLMATSKVVPSIERGLFAKPTSSSEMQEGVGEKDSMQAQLQAQEDQQLSGISFRFKILIP